MNNIAPLHKGFVYTLFVISFITALMLFISIQNSRSNSEIAEKIRADEVLSFVRAVSDDINRGAFISGKRALLGLTSKIVEGNGTFPSGANSSARELAINGTLNGIYADIMENSTIVNWTDALRIIGSEEHFITNFSVESTNVVPASSFEIAFKSNVSVYIYDPFTKITYNRTILSVQYVPIEQLEDPYITVKSLGTVTNTFKGCHSSKGSAYGGAWAYGKIYSSNQSDFSGVSLQEEKVLVTNSTVGKSGYNSFKAIVTETAADPAPAQPYILGVPNAAALSKNGSYAVLSSGVLWLTNDTSCYFESPEGPSFFDRLEGRGALSVKYSLPDKITGLGSFIRTFSGGWVLDYEYYG